MPNHAILRAISDFGAQGERVTFQGRTVEVDTMGEPVAQFEYGDKYLLLLPDDSFENALCSVVLLNQSLKKIEYHLLPDSQIEAALPEIHAVSDNEIRVQWGPGNDWIVQLLPSPKYMPMEAYQRVTSGWHPVFEWPFCLKRSYLRFRKG